MIVCNTTVENILHAGKWFRAKRTVYLSAITPDFKINEISAKEPLSPLLMY